MFHKLVYLRDLYLKSLARVPTPGKSVRVTCISKFVVGLLLYGFFRLIGKRFAPQKEIGREENGVIPVHYCVTYRRPITVSKHCSIKKAHVILGTDNRYT